MFNPKLGEKPLSYNELILERLKELKDGQRELKTELKAELQMTKHELNDRMEKLENRMTGIESEMRNVGRHSQIMTASVVGIALAVVYFIFTH
ncbi:MAG: hypothetical protein IJ774_13925 [Selenomonadaceae bacterium]|nr:hypothetical protein [Selenomonadaceae bacterium]MBR1807470.1 hypothetical protein [Selenomonadaceae bacterium]